MLYLNLKDTLYSIEWRAISLRISYSKKILLVFNRLYYIFIHSSCFKCSFLNFQRNSNMILFIQICFRRFLLCNEKNLIWLNAVFGKI